MIPQEISPVFNWGKDIIANGDAGLLKQVFVNLIRNAIQAMPKGGDLKINNTKKLSIRKISRSIGLLPTIYNRHRRRSGRTVFQKKILTNIFNPFFTTKDHGTGLGLSISHNIIKAHQGTIDVENNDGQGARFIIKIPYWDHELDKK